MSEVSKDAVINALSSRVSKDVGDALMHLEVYEVVGILEMIKSTVCIQTHKTITEGAPA